MSEVVAVTLQRKSYLYGVSILNNQDHEEPLIEELSTASTQYDLTTLISQVSFLGQLCHLRCGTTLSHPLPLE